MLNIKLAKVGKTNKKVFRLIISEKGRDPHGRVLEILGSYNPYIKDLQVKEDRVKYWISKGAGMTATVNNLLVGQGIIEGSKVTASKKGQPNEKKLAQKKAKADKAKEATAAPAVEKPAKSEDDQTTKEDNAKPTEEPKKEDANNEEAVTETVTEDKETK